MSNPFLALNEKRGVLLAAHRGYYGGNIPFNSRPAFQIALNHDADIVELDIERTEDGKLFVLHPGTEPHIIRLKDSIKRYPSDFVARFKLSNDDGGETAHPILRLEEALDFLKGKCIVNLDKFWMNPEAIAKLVRERNMQDQVLLKISLNEKQIKDTEIYAPDMPLMPMVWTEDPCLEMMKNYNVRYVGSECLFVKDTDPIASPEYIEAMHKAGKTVWANGIMYNYRKELAGGHSYVNSLLVDPEMGWGWLADRGFDIIQTDWLFQCDTYLKQTGRRK